MCFLCQQSPAVDWHGLMDTSLIAQEAGTAQGAASNGATAGFNPNLINQLDGAGEWRTSSGQIATNITFGITNSNSFAAGSTEGAGWSALNGTQANAAREAIRLWDDLIRPSITESGSPNTADIKFSNSTSGVGYALGYYPGIVGDENSYNARIAGSAWFNPNSANAANPVSGNYGFSTFMHEIGHTLGLNHAGNYNGGSPAYGNSSTGWLYTEDSRQFTVMSYFAASATGANWGNQSSQTPMVYDIMAIQRAYGADYSTRAGDTVYGHNSNTGVRIYDFYQNSLPVLTIWDGNGTDTIDLSGWNSASNLSLVAGAYSDANGMTKNLAIAYDVDIENARTGGGNDTVTGNDIGNNIASGAGADTILGAGGNDVLDGGSGRDVLQGGEGNDTIYIDAEDDLSQVTGGNGFDTVVLRGFSSTFNFATTGFESVQQGGSPQPTPTPNPTPTPTPTPTPNPTPSTGANSAPVFTGQTYQTAAENQTRAAQITAWDTAGETLSFSIAGGADASKFRIDANSGLLTFITAPDYEARGDADGNNTYQVRIGVSDGKVSTYGNFDIGVTDVAESTNVVNPPANPTPTPPTSSGPNTAPVFTGQTYQTAPENQTRAAQITSWDTPGESKSYSIAGGADASKFRIDANSGLLTFVTAPDFEARGDADRNNVYQVQIGVSDGKVTTFGNFEIGVTDIAETTNVVNTPTNPSPTPTPTAPSGPNTAPVFTGYLYRTVAENQTAAATINAWDTPGETLRYSVAGGADGAKFRIDTSTGVLTFVTAPDYEAPTDAGGNNVYDVRIAVTDGRATTYGDFNFGINNVAGQAIDETEWNFAVFGGQNEIISTADSDATVASAADLQVQLAANSGNDWLFA
jgi:hypothetical protein